MGFTDFSCVEFEVGKYKLTQLGMDAWGKYCRYIQYRDSYLLEENKKNGLPVPDDLISETYQKCKNNPIQIDSKEIGSSLINPDCVTYILYLAALPNHQNITKEEAGRIIAFTKYSDNIDLVYAILGLEKSEATDEKNL